MMPRAGRAAPLAVLAVVAVLAVLAGCSGVKNRVSRSDWLARELLARHADLLERDPGAVAEKLARMSGNRFDYFRGSAELLPPSPSRFAPPAASQVAVMGDPHPENIGTYPLPDAGADGQLAVDFNDFDLAGRGPFTGDLQRLALGLWVAGDMAGLGKKQRTRLVEALTEGYLEEIRSLAQGQPAFTLRAATAFDGGLEEILAAPDTLDDTGAGAVEVTGQERAALAAALLEYRRSLLDPAIAPPPALAVKRAVRTRAGISSFPLLRYRVLVEGPSAAAEDDWTLELKESRGRDPAAVVRQQRQMQERLDLDPYLGWTTLDGRGLRVRRFSDQHRRLSIERLVAAIKSPRWGKKDLRALARDCGRLLGRAHGRPATGQGEPGAQVIARAAGDGRGLSYETVQQTERTADVLEQDRQHLKTLIRERGPLLGWQPGKK